MCNGAFFPLVFLLIIIVQNNTLIIELLSHLKCRADWDRDVSFRVFQGVLGPNNVSTEKKLHVLQSPFNFMLLDSYIVLLGYIHYELLLIFDPRL